jgi:hypothetical protein
MNTSKILGIIVVILLVLGGAYYVLEKRSDVPATGDMSTTTPDNGGSMQSDTLTYTNSKYGFVFTLPKSWEGYSIVETQWVGDSIDNSGNLHTGTIKGPEILIRNPQWSSSTPMQDIPIMIFTIAQWNDMQADKFHIGAAPINPSEINRGNVYVYGLPARYNFAYLPGFEEVDQILQSDPLEPISAM